MNVRSEVIGFLQMARSMRASLPDGQWEDGLEEMYDELVELKRAYGALPDATDPIWEAYKQEVDRNASWWI